MAKAAASRSVSAAVPLPALPSNLEQTPAGPGPASSTPVRKRKKSQPPQPSASDAPSSSQLSLNNTTNGNVDGEEGVAKKRRGRRAASKPVVAPTTDNESRMTDKGNETMTPDNTTAALPPAGRGARGKAAKNAATAASEAASALLPPPPPKVPDVAFASIKVRVGGQVLDNLHVPISVDSSLVWLQEYLITETRFGPTATFDFSYVDSSVSPPEHYTFTNENRFNSFKQWALHAPVGTKIAVDAIITEELFDQIHDAPAPSPSLQKAAASSALAAAVDAVVPAADPPAPSPPAAPSSSTSRKNLGCGICSSPDAHAVESCPWIMEGDYPKLQARFNTLKDLQQRKKGHERTAQKDLKLWLKENKVKTRKRTKKATATATDTESGPDTPNNYETDAGEADAEGDEDDDDEENNDELADAPAPAASRASTSTSAAKAEQSTENGSRGCLICSSPVAHPFLKCPWLHATNTNKVRSRLVILKAMPQRDLKLEKKLGAWLKSQGVTVPRMKRKADSDSTNKDQTHDAEHDEVEGTDVDEDAEGEPDEDETDAAAAEAAAGSASLASVAPAPAATPTRSSARISTEEVTSPRKSGAASSNLFCGICSTEDDHGVSQCPWILQGDVPKLRERLDQLKALQQRKKQPERDAQREIQEWLKSQNLRGNRKSAASTSTHHAAAAAAAAEEMDQLQASQESVAAAAAPNASTSSFSPYTKLTSLQPTIFRKSGMGFPGLMPNFGYGGDSQASNISGSQQSVGSASHAAPHAQSGTMPPGSVGFDGSVAHPKHLLSGLTNPVHQQGGSSSSSSDSDSDETIEEDSSDEDTSRRTVGGKTNGAAASPAGKNKRVSMSHVPPEKRLGGSSTKKVKKPKSALAGL
ncbi:hypothetical protein CF319_g5624 [Tilletia indica]|nr:hypothetical protein CF319_g5624 [Tilletia indica]